MEFRAINRVKYYDGVGVNATLNANEVKSIMNYAIEKQILPSFLIAQLWYESGFFSSEVSKRNNNGSGMSYFESVDSYESVHGVTRYRGTPRPASESAYYVKYISKDDFFKDWTGLLADGENNIKYNVVGHDNFNDTVKGLFIVGGATHDYAATGYENYKQTMTSVRSDNNINGYMDTLDNYYFSMIDDENEDKTPIEEIPIDIDEDNPLYRLMQLIGNIDPTSKLNDSYTIINRFLSTALDTLISFFEIEINRQFFDYQDSQTKSNRLIKVIEMYPKQYQIQVTTNLTEILINAISQALGNNVGDFLDGFELKNPIPIPEPEHDETDPKEKEDDEIVNDTTDIFTVNGDETAIIPMEHNICYITHVFGFRGYRRNNAYTVKPDHWGIDFVPYRNGVLNNAYCYAVFSGTVERSGVDYNANVGTSGYRDNWVRIRHDDGSHADYRHFWESHVSSGQRVNQGDVIGTIGNTGFSSGTHLHFEFRASNGYALSPHHVFKHINKYQQELDKWYNNTGLVGRNTPKNVGITQNEINSYNLFQVSPYEWNYKTYESGYYDGLSNHLNI